MSVLVVTFRDLRARRKLLKLLLVEFGGSMMRIPCDIATLIAFVGDDQKAALLLLFVLVDHHLVLA